MITNNSAISQARKNNLFHMCLTHATSSLCNAHDQSNNADEQQAILEVIESINAIFASHIDA